MIMWVHIICMRSAYNAIQNKIVIGGSFVLTFLFLWDFRKKKRFFLFSIVTVSSLSMQLKSK